MRVPDTCMPARLINIYLVKAFMSMPPPSCRDSQHARNQGGVVVMAQLMQALLHSHHAIVVVGIMIYIHTIFIVSDGALV